MERLCVENISRLSLSGKCGIYCIRISDRDYIGSSLDLNARLREHLLDLSMKRHGNRKLQNAYNFHKEASFEIVEYCSEEIRVEREYLHYRERGYYNLKDPKENTNFVQSKIVYQYDLDGNFVQTFKSTGCAARALGLHQSAISKACSQDVYGKYHGGFLWSYSLETGLRRKTHTASSVYVYDLEGNFVKEYYSIEECGDQLTLLFDLPKTHLANSIRQAVDKQKCVKGFQFRTIFLEKITPYKRGNKLKVYQYDLEWNLVCIYEGARECSETTGYSRPNICRACKQEKPYKGFYFRYKVLGKLGELSGKP